MRVINISLSELGTKILMIGFEGENQITQVRIDAAEILTDHPNATPTLIAKPLFGFAYPVIVTKEGTDVVWEIDNSVLSFHGDGEIQLTFTEGTVIAKSYVGRIRIKRSLEVNGEKPDPIETWEQAATAKLAEVDAQISELEGMVDAAEAAKDQAQDIVDDAAADIQAAGATQIAAVEAKGEEVKDSIPSDYTALTGEVSGLKSAMSELPPVKDSDKVGVDLDISDPQGNVILRLANGHIQTKEFDSSELLDELGEKLNEPETAGASGQVLGLDSDLNPVWMDQTGGDSNTAVKNSTETGIDLDVSDNYGNVVMRLKNGEIHTKYFHSKPTIITLKPTGGDFSTLKAALDSIIDADPETNPYEIHVYPGTYDTLEGFTDAEIRSADIGGGYTDDSMVGCKLTNGISLIGIGDRGKIILTAELSASDYPLSARGNISTLNLQGTCRIENLTIKAKNIRYCIHDDFGSDDHYVRIVKNCAFSAYSWSTAYYPATTYGAGIANPGITALFEDCDFGFNFGFHTRQYMAGDSDLVFKHCRGLVARLGDSSRETDESIHRFHFDGCNFSAISITRPTATTPHIFIDGTNNLSTMLFCKAEDIPQFASMMKATVSVLPVGTVVKVNNGCMTTSSAGIMAAKADSIESAIGVIAYKDSEYDYIQTEGYIQGYLLGITGLSVGNYITCDSDMMLTSIGATAANAFGVVKYTDDDDNSQIWMIKGRA